MKQQPDLSLEQVAELIGVGVRRARRLRRLHRFPNAYNIKSDLKPEWRVPPEDVKAFRRNRRAA